MMSRSRRCITAALATLAAIPPYLALLDERVSFRLLSAKQLGQTAMPGSNAPCFIARQPVRSRAPVGFILEVDIRERLPVLVRKRCSAMMPNVTFPNRRRKSCVVLYSRSWSLRR